MYSVALIALGASLASAQFVPPPPLGTLTSTLSGVLPVLPTPFNGVRTNQGAIIAADKLPFNPAVTPVGGVAMTQSNQPAATYVATLPAVAFNQLVGSVIRGTVTASTNQGQTGVTFTFNLTGFPNVTAYGAFPYHIHNLPVPADGNCTSVLGHFDTTNAGELYVSNASYPQLLQTGDLAGKHGRINGTIYTTSYVDSFLSLDPASPYFFGTKSIVFHTSNSTRITCANFTMRASNSTGGSSATSTVVVPSGTGSPSTTSRPATFSGAANQMLAGAGSVAAAIAAGLLAL